MTLLSRKADYALLILSYLYRSPTGGNAREIAAQFGLSRAFVANILKELCQKGFVASHRGVKGGYALQPDAAGASLATLLDALDDGFRLTLCTPPSQQIDGCSHESSCSLKAPLGEVHRRLIDVLRGVTLAQLFEPDGPHRGVGLPLLPLLATTAGGCCQSARHAAAEPEPVPATA